MTVGAGDVTALGERFLEALTLRHGASDEGDAGTE